MISRTNSGSPGLTDTAIVSLKAEDYFKLLSCQKTERDEEVIEAAFIWRRDMYEGSYRLLKAVEAHPDFKTV